MVYPTTKSWENFASQNDPDNFMKNTGVMPTAFKKMIARLTGTEGNEELEPEEDKQEQEDADEDVDPDDGDDEAGIFSEDEDATDEEYESVDE